MVVNVETYILGIESTSHTFGVGVVSSSDKGIRILANVNERYVPSKGGIHPREAAIHHSKNAVQTIMKALGEAGLRIDDLSGVAVALGPGLGPCIRVGASIARFLSSYYGKPLIPVNHAIAHVEIGKFINNFTDPVVVYVSGGNTLVAVQKARRYRIIGETLDIPLGNLFDTFVREIGLAPPYVEGGLHKIDICAEWAPGFTPLPYTVKGCDLSFSGLLTAALKLARKYGDDRGKLGNICFSLRETAFNMLIEVSERTLALFRKKELLLVGGVASNKKLIEKFELLSNAYGVRFGYVPPEYAGDNGAMIAYTGLLMYKYGLTVKPEEAYVKQRWRIDEVELPWLTI
uniref:tRNA N6-adenosine threonylcarbamoyltransferase n=1 Tax=Staphylothermus marinus TaxID=2280 RepID=A0A7C4JLS9_STAMA